MSPTRLAELDSLKSSLRRIVFQDGPRGEKAAKLLRMVRERIEEAEAPARKAAEKAAKAEREAWGAYAEVALSEDTERPAEEHAAHRRVEHLCGGIERAFRLLRLLTDSREERIRQSMETEGDFSARIARVTARKARAEGYSANAVRALLAVQ